MADAKRYVKKGYKKLHAATKAAVVLSLLVGIALGAVAGFLLSQSNDFSLKGEKSMDLELGTAGTAYRYGEQGVIFTYFGLDLSSRVKVESDLEKDETGFYLIPADKPGVYTITYTADLPLSPGEPVKRIRVFSVGMKEETNG